MDTNKVIGRYFIIAIFLLIGFSYLTLPSVHAAQQVIEYLSAATSTNSPDAYSPDAYSPDAYSPDANVSNLVVTEIHYNPVDSSFFEYIELKNVGTSQLDLAGVSITGGITATLSSNVLQPGDFAIVTRNIAAFTSRYSTTTSSWYQSGLIVDGPWLGGLKNSGESFTVSAADGSVISVITYSDRGDWPTRADGDGSAVELVDSAAVPTTQPAKDAYLADGNNWGSTSEYHGSPGRDGLGSDNRVVINEVLAHTDLPAVDTIELKNTTAAAIDISGWLLSDSPSPLAKYIFPAGSIIAAGDYLVIDETDFNSAISATSPVTFALSSSNGEDIYLVETGAASMPARFVDRVDFGATATGESYGRWPDGLGELYPMTNQTFGAAGQPNETGGNTVRSGPVVISEVHYNPAGVDNNLEYIELYNNGTVAEDLSNWRLRGTVDYDFAGGPIVPAGEFIVMVGFDPADATLTSAFQSAYGISNAVTLIGPWKDGVLLNVLLPDQGSIKLQRPDAPTTDPIPFYPMLEEDTVRYDSVAPWPTAPLESGPALERIDLNYYGDDPTNWQPSAPAGGSPGSIPLPTPTPVPTDTPTTIPTDTPTPLPTDTPIPTDTPTVAPTDTPTIVPTPTDTPTPPPTNTPVPVPTNTSVPVFTNTPVPAATNTSVPIPTNTPDPSGLPTATSLPTNTAVPVTPNTPIPVATNTPVPVVATNTSVPFTPTPTATSTPIPTATNTSTATSTPTDIPTSTPTAIPTSTATVVPIITPTITPTQIAITPTPVATAQPFISLNTMAEEGQSNVTIMWRFNTDGPTTGFHILRSSTDNIDEAEQITETMIPAYLTGIHEYEFVDKSLTQSGDYYYWVQEERHNESTQFWGGILESFSTSLKVYLPHVSR